VSDIAKKTRDLDIGAIPVGDNDRLIGMVSKGIVYCRDTEELEDALCIMEQKQVRRLPVINDQKRMVGMLSLGDISHAASHELSGEVMAAVSAS
jgi:CBS domain-containing protein